MWRVLCVDDSPDTQRLVARALEPGVRVSCVGSLAEATERLARETPDLVLLDVGLPDGEGFRLCTHLQGDESMRSLPVVFLTGRGETPDKVMAFSLGADDYVVKPFDVHELRARVEARLRKAHARAQRAEVLRRGDLRIHVVEYRAIRVEDGDEIDLGLTPHEFKLLRQLAAREGQVFTRGQLLDAVWQDAVVTERTVDTHISNLRKKLGRLGPSIQAVRGLGYRFACEAD